MTEKFHERFHIEIPMDEVKRRFVNRAHNTILNGGWIANFVSWEKACRSAADKLGELYSVRDHFHNQTLDKLTGHDFNHTLHAIEGVRAAARDFKEAVPMIDKKIGELLRASEVDLNVVWSNGVFLPAGATFLDTECVNSPLEWLREKHYQTVHSAFEKALGHLLRSRADPSLLSDVVTDAFDALESLAKVVVGNDKTLDANRELFLSKVKVSDDYKTILKPYCDHAHKIRHGARTPKPTISYAEAESFVYLTGLFIRLAISTTSPASAAVPAP